MELSKHKEISEIAEYSKNMCFIFGDLVEPIDELIYLNLIDKEKLEKLIDYSKDDDLESIGQFLIELNPSKKIPSLIKKERDRRIRHKQMVTFREHFRRLKPNKITVSLAFHNEVLIYFVGSKCIKDKKVVEYEGVPVQIENNKSYIMA